MKPNSDNPPFLEGMMSAVLGIAIGCVGLLYVAFVYGFVASRIWEWHAVPNLGVRHASWQVCGALILVVRLISYGGCKPDPANNKWPVALTLLAAPWLVLLMGWWLR